MKLCSENHEEIIYDNHKYDCPVCAIRIENKALLEAQTKSIDIINEQVELIERLTENLN